MANDNFAYAKDFYQANLPDTDYRLCDVTDVDSFASADLLAGCYPCQGFSQGRARDPKRKLNHLYREFDRVLRKIKPKAFIVENVSGMSRRDFRHLLNNQVVRFRLAGYRVTCKMLDAKQYGVPQDRERIFIVGIRSDLGTTYDFPSPTHGCDDKPFLTIAEMIGDQHQTVTRLLQGTTSSTNSPTRVYSDPRTAFAVAEEATLAIRSRGCTPS